MRGSPSPARVRIIGWAIIALLPLLLLGGIEAGVRLLGISPSVAPQGGVPAWLDRNILVKDADWIARLSESPRDLGSYYGTYRWDRKLFYRLRPGVEVSLTDALAPAGIRPRTRWTLRTNRRGFPGPDVEPGPHPGTFRILCMGDSSTFGWGVDPSEAYPARLQDELRRRHPGRSIETVNLGVCGYSSFQGRILLESEGLAYEPDVVTLSYGSNDWSRVPEPFDEAYARNAGWTGGFRALLHMSRAYQVYAAFLGGHATREGAPPAEAGGVGDANMPLNVGPEKSEQNVREMIRAARQRGAEPVVVTNCVSDWMAEPIVAAAGADGATLVDTAQLLRAWIPRVATDERLAAERARVESIYGRGQVEEHPGLHVYLADGCHPNAVGHRILAERIADVIERTPAFTSFLDR